MLAAQTLVDPNLLGKLRRSSVEIHSHSRSRTRGGGSGIIWNSGGIVVTNAHVVRADGVTVRLHDRRECEASLLSIDRKRDLAVLRISAGSLAEPEIGDSSLLRAGYIVTAIGNPLGLVGAISAGIVHSTSDPRWIQADLQLAPGNSGGILADDRGRVVGVNTMIYSGIAIAIPSNIAAAFVRETLANLPSASHRENRAA